MKMKSELERDLSPDKKKRKVLEKLHKCEVCYARFTEERYVKKHIRSVHEGIKPFKCNICNANFGQKVNLNQHVSRVHEGIR